MTDQSITTLSTQNQPTMSSLEITELTGKQHSHVKRDIKKIFKDIGERCPRMDSFGYLRKLKNGPTTNKLLTIA